MFRCPATNWEARKQMKDNETQQPLVCLEDAAYATERNPTCIEFQSNLFKSCTTSA